jgi:hypothetical protein
MSSRAWNILRQTEQCKCILRLKARASRQQSKHDNKCCAPTQNGRPILQMRPQPHHSSLLVKISACSIQATDKLIAQMGCNTLLSYCHDGGRNHNLKITVKMPPSNGQSLIFYSIYANDRF